MTDNISTNTVFHFTKSIDCLESILTNDFYPQLCIEDIFGPLAGELEAEKAIPMVCFCDIPLSQIKKHIKNYGEYAIGLSKEWAIRNKINPVLYTFSNSNFSNNLNKALYPLVHSKFGEKNEVKKITNQLLSAIQYIKPYEGKLWQKGKRSGNLIRFYDEREWRYIPNTPDGETPYWLRVKDIESKKANIEELNKEFASVISLRLSFEPKDIKFIIVKQEDEILSMMDKVINIKRHKFSYKDVQILTTRIISMKNIKENF